MRLLTIAALLSLLLSSSAQRRCRADGDCGGGGQCCSTYGFCGTGPDYCRPGCVLEDVEILGGDLIPELGGGGFAADYDDSCAKECEDTPQCSYWTFNLRSKQCFLKSGRDALRQSGERRTFISGSTFNNGCEPDPPCEPPKQIIDGICRTPAPAPPASRPSFIFPDLKPTTTPTTSFVTVATTTPLPVNLPQPPRPISQPGPLPSLPTLPPQIASQTFIEPPLVSETFQGAFDYCANLGGILPSPDFFDIYRIGRREAPRTNTSVLESEAATSDTQEVEYVDTSVDFVDENGFNRVKRQLNNGAGYQGFWYWLNNFNDGKTCYAALPGDVVQFRAFPCSDLLRVICQYGPDDTRPLFTSIRTTTSTTTTTTRRPQRRPLPPLRRQNEIVQGPAVVLRRLQPQQVASVPLENYVPDSIIRANPRQPFFAKNGLTNPYLSYHAKILRRQREKKRQQELSAQSTSPISDSSSSANFNGIRIFFGDK